MKENEKPQQVQLEIQADDQTAQGVYANLAGVTHSETEFIFDFLFMQPNQPKAKIRARIISSPVHTKRFLQALAENVKRYEERFGVIPQREAVPHGHS
ncbi:MAG: DUF3467 domain-containing protein [Elusimicrobia bacterium]|nr:DUF3467 domain-containing protein [Elusimicrobiota bacterium]